MISHGNCCIYNEPVSCDSETVAGDDDCRTSSYAYEKDDYTYIDEFVTTRAQDTSTKCKGSTLRDILVSEKVSQLDWIKTNILIPTIKLASFGKIKLHAQRRLQSFLSRCKAARHIR